jgi:hypothetical protein
LLASDGFHTDSAQTGVDVPDRQPDVSILAPRDGQTLAADGAMRLWGAATHPGTGEHAHEARWLIDGEPVAEGLDAFVTAPPPGEHLLELVVAGDPETAVSSRFITVATGPSEEPAAA